MAPLLHRAAITKMGDVDTTLWYGVSITIDHDRCMRKTVQFTFRTSTIAYYKLEM